MMNGPVSASMREKGLTYKVNFGVELPRLQEFASELPHEHDLAQALWKEDIRECRLLAAMLQPTETFYPDIADIWVESMRFTEEMECTVFSLFQHLPYASQKCFEWMAHPAANFQQCGFLLIARLFGQGLTPNPRDEAEFLDQAVTAMHADNYAVSQAARRALTRFMDLGEEQEKKVQNLLAEQTES